MHQNNTGGMRLVFLNKTRRYLSKASLQGKYGYDTLKGESRDISIFRFRWFEPIWFYNPNLSFPRDNMEPSFSLDVADNTGDGFSCVILPVNKYTDIPITRNTVTLVRSCVCVAA